MNELNGEMKIKLTDFVLSNRGIGYIHIHIHIQNTRSRKTYLISLFSCWHMRKRRGFVC